MTHILCYKYVLFLFYNIKEGIMIWLVYENLDEATQIFVGVILILSITFVVGANIYFWISDKIKNSKQK